MRKILNLMLDFLLATGLPGRGGHKSRGAFARAYVK
jgi:hypothetical protein